LNNDILQTKPECLIKKINPSRKGLSLLEKNFFVLKKISLIFFIIQYLITPIHSITYEIPPIVVTAKKNPLHLKSSNYVTSLTINESTASHQAFSELINKTVGLTINRFGSEGHTSTISIRGSSSSQVLVLYDGIPLNSLSGGLDLSSLSLGNIKRIDIYRGIKSALFGSSAFGGVINITSKKQPEISNLFSIKTGSSNTFNTRYQSTIKLNPIHLAVNLEHFYNNGIFSYPNDQGTQYNKDDDIINQRTNNAISGYNASFKIAVPQALNSQIFYQTQSARKGTPGPINSPSEKAFTSEERNLFQFETNLSSFLPDNFILHSSLFQIHFSRNYEDPDGEITGAPYKILQNEIRTGIKSNLLTSLPYDFSLSSQIQFQYNKMLDNNEFLASQKMAEISATIEKHFFNKNLLLNLNSLLAHYSQNTTYHSVSSGILYKLNPNIYLKANIGNAFRVPSFTEKFSRYSYFFPNPDLKAETAVEWETGIGIESQNFTLESVYYQRDVKDLIEWNMISNFMVKPINTGTALIKGIELNISLKQQQHILSANLNLIKAINQDNLPVISIPKYKWNIRLSNQLSKNILTYTEYQTIGGNILTIGSKNYLPDRKYLNMGTEITIQENSIICLSFNNILNNQAEDQYGFPLPGQQFFLSSTIQI
jgi:vitamin B12 transporter